MTQQYWYKKPTPMGPMTKGPYSLEDMRQAYRQGELGRAHQVSIDGGDDWQSAERFPEIFQRRPAPPPPPPPPPPPQEEEEDPPIEIDLGPPPRAPRGEIQAEVFCRECGTGLKRRAVICPQCGVPTGGGSAGGGFPGGGDKKNKYVAAAFAFFLGGIGAHHFYLGNAMLGVVYLLFFWTLIPALIAFIEFIVYLAMSESAFDRKYNRAAL